MTKLWVRGAPFEFVFFEDASQSFAEHDDVWCIRLRDEHDRHIDALYFPGKHDNFIIKSSFDLTEREAQNLSLAAFCFLSVILKSS